MHIVSLDLCAKTFPWRDIWQTLVKLKINIYTSADLNVKVTVKEENKNLTVQDTKTRYKPDTLVAGATGCAKFVLWKDMVDKVTKKLQFQKSNSSNSQWHQISQ